MLELEEERIGIVLAFTSRLDGQLTRGTADCVRRALAMKLPVRSNSTLFHAVKLEVRQVSNVKEFEHIMKTEGLNKTCNHGMRRRDCLGCISD